MTTRDIQVPIGPYPSADAVADVARWTSLFPSGALERRADLLRPILEMEGIDLDDRRLAAARASLSLGTSTEVALRLIGKRASEEDLALADAIAALTRVTFGLMGKRRRPNDPITLAFCGAVRNALSRHGDLQVIYNDWLSVQSIMEKSHQERAWTETDIAVVADNQPLHLSTRILDRLSTGLDPHLLQLSQSYGATYWLANDLLKLGDTGRPDVGPIGDKIFAAAPTSEMRLYVKPVIALLNKSAFRLRGVIDTLGDSLATDMRTYGEATIRLAAAAYSRSTSILG